MDLITLPNSYIHVVRILLWILSFVTHDKNSFLNKFIRWCAKKEDEEGVEGNISG